MPSFRYEGINDEGKYEKGEISATDERSAYQALAAIGILSTNLSDNDAPLPIVPWYRKDIELGGNRISLASQAEIASQLSVLLAAKIPVVDAVQILARSASGFAAQRRFGRIANLLKDGATLSDAFRSLNIEISPLFSSILKLTDEIAEPAAPVASLASFLRQQDRARRQFLGALVYPAVLIVTALGVLALVALFLAPNLRPMFEALNKPPPVAIAFFDAIGRLVTQNVGLLSTVGLIIIFFAALASQSTKLKANTGKMAARAPLIGWSLRSAELARLTRSLAMLIEAGLPLSTAFRQTATVVGGETFSRSFVECADSLDEGYPAAAVLARNDRIPATYLELFRVAESSNMLSTVLPVLAADLEDRAEQSLGRVLTLMTPIMTLVIGGAIAMLVYSVMSAILSVNEIAL